MKRDPEYMRCGIAVFLLALLMQTEASGVVVRADSSSSGERRIRVNGYVKDLQTFLFTDKKGSLVSGNLIHNRINARWQLNGNLTARAEIRNRFLFGEQVKLNPSTGKWMEEDNGILKLSMNLLEDTAAVFNSTIDRLLLNWSDEKWDISLGRQRINWGVNLAWNPNDVFNTYNYFDFDYQERPGTDALRVCYQDSRGRTMEAAYKPAKNKEQHIAAFLYRFKKGTYDMQGLAGLYLMDMVLGAAWAGNIGKTGFKGEMSYFHARKNPADTFGDLSAAISLDRSFRYGFFATLSYLYCSGGGLRPGGVADLSTAVLSPKRIMPFEHSFLINVNKNIGTLLNAGLSLVYAPERNSLITMAMLSYSVAEAWDLSLVSQHYFSESAGVYKTLGNAVFLRLMWSY